jgi:hypothetical protein
LSATRNGSGKSFVQIQPRKLCLGPEAAAKMLSRRLGLVDVDLAPDFALLGSKRQLATRRCVAISDDSYPGDAVGVACGAWAATEARPHWVAQLRMSNSCPAVTARNLVQKD